MTDETDATAVLDMTVGIVSNYLANNKLAAGEVAALIASTHAALVATSGGAGEPEAEPVDKPTAAQVRRSVSEKGIVSFVDGKTYQSLKRHLGTNGHTPQSYREAYGLPGDYPMVSPTYAARRSELAKASGLGQGGRKPKGPARKAAASKAKSG